MTKYLFSAFSIFFLLSFNIINLCIAIALPNEGQSENILSNISNSTLLTTCVVGMCAQQPNETVCDATCDCRWTTVGCNCIHRGDGSPPCQDQYPPPDNSTIILLATSSLISSSDRITFFGDSITERLGYINLINQTLNSYNITPTIFPRGVGGATIKDIRDGYHGQPSFDDVLQQDQPSLVNIMIGINDIYRAGQNDTSTYAEFKDILIDLVQRVQKFGAKIAVSTVSVSGEQINGLNGNDTHISQFADATRVVAAITGAALSDVHLAYLDYEQRYNIYPEGVGLYSGILTYEGVHPCRDITACPVTSYGNIVLANAISKGLIEALSKN